MFDYLKNKAAKVFSSLVNYQGDDKFSHWPGDDVSPKALESLKKSIESGRLDEWEQLLMTISGKWPEYVKNTEDVSNAVSRMQWTVIPFAGNGEKPTPEAQEYASLVSSAFFKSFAKPDSREVDWQSMIKLLCYTVWNGYSVLEILWAANKDMVYPRAYMPVSAKYFAWPYGNVDDRLLFYPSTVDRGSMLDGVAFQDNKFLIGINKSTPYHPIFNATARSLIGYFGAAVWGLSWLMSYSHQFGKPFMHVKTATKADSKEAMEMLKKMSNGGIATSTKDFEVQFLDAMKGGNSIPQSALLDRADEQCDKLILGQTLTSKSDGSGSYALGKVHDGVRHDVVKNVSSRVVGVLNSQLIPAIMKMNYGTVPECLPYFEASIPGDIENQDQVDYYDKLINNIGLDVGREHLHDVFKIPIPQKGEDVISKSEGDAFDWDDNVAAAARMRGKAMRR